MKLIGLIEELRKELNPGVLKEKERKAIDYESTDLCMVGFISLDSDIRLFDADSIPDDIDFHFDGVKYVNLCPYQMLIDFVETAFNSPGESYNSLRIANLFIDYIQNDA